MKVIDSNDIVLKQEKMGMGVLVTTIIVMMTIQWMTLDMYLPALPVLKEEFHTSEAALNVSLNTDMFFFAVGTLIGGTISDKYGRKPIIIIGLFLSVLSMFFCAGSQGVFFLSAMRGLCGFGGGLAIAVSSAVIRDSFENRTFQTITTLSQAIAFIGPIFAPAMGSFMIEFLSWRSIFIFLGVTSLLTLLPFLLFTETWPQAKRQVSSVWQATVQSFDFARDKEYMIFMLFMSLLTFPLWAYLSTCAYIYYDVFGVSNLQYSLLYAAGTVAASLAPFIYIWLDRRSSSRRVIDLCFALLIVSLGALIAICTKSPVLFLLAIIPPFMVESIVRALGLVVVLEQYPQKAGSASSVTGFIFSVVSVLITTLATLHWSSFFLAVGVITGASLLLAVIVWIIILRRGVYAGPLGLRK